MQLSFTGMAGLIITPEDYSFKVSGRILILLMLLFSSSQLIAQEETRREDSMKRKIIVKHADEGIDEAEKGTGRKLTRLLGNVELEHNEITMNCDSAHFYPGMNQVQAFSRIHIRQGDTLHLTGNYLNYDGSTEIAFVEGDVELIDRETHLFTNSINYDVTNRIARYTSNGRIINGDNTLTSKTGIYYAEEKTFHFKDSVRIVNPDYVMIADTMDYNTVTETAFFTGPSVLEGDSIYIYCEKGWYDTKNDLSRLWKNAVIDNRRQVIRGDSLYYDNNMGYGEAFGSINIADTTNNIIICGNYAWYYKQPEEFLVTDKALFIQISNGDSLFLHADTITAITVNDTTDASYRLMRAYRGCRVFGEQIQARCDSLAYSYRDSVIRLYHYPVIWNEENQLTADSMAIFTVNRQTDRMELYNSAFVISQVDDLRFNQVKGRMLTGYFTDNKIYRIDIEGNGETIYYLVDGDEIVGINRAKCSRIEIFVEDGDITEIYEHQNPSGIIDPPDPDVKDVLKLEGFEWLDNLRPKKMSDIFEK